MSDEIYTESWFGQGEEAAVGYALDQAVGVEGISVEIGSFEGRSTVYLANRLAPVLLYAVDTWQGGAEAPYEQMKYETTPIERNFDHNMKVATQGNVRKTKMDWESFISEVSKPIAFLYLDGPHDYASVYKSLEMIVPKLAVGGVLCGDDYDDVSVHDAVVDYFGYAPNHPTGFPRTFFYKKEKAI